MKPVATATLRSALATTLLLLLTVQVSDAQCVLQQNGITVELVLNGANSDGTFTYVWDVSYGANALRIDSLYFQKTTPGAPVSDPGYEPPFTQWSIDEDTFFPGGVVPAISFKHTGGLILQRNRTFTFFYTTPFVDPVRVRGISTTNAGTVADIFDQVFDESACGLLPVELTRFDAITDGGLTRLTWETASELNNAGFEIEHAVGDGAFEAINFQEGAGTTIKAQRYGFDIENLAPGRHRFRLKQVDFDGAFAYSDEVEVEVELPSQAYLSEAYPNPFNPQTQFTLTLARDEHVRIEVFNAMGQRVAVLQDGILAASEAHAFTFEAGSLPSGIYMYRATGETFAQTQRVTLVK